MKTALRKIGLIVNPVAGMGGRVGLKGSDGADIQQKARSLGAVPEAANKALIALKQIELKDEYEFLTGPGEMGEDCARQAGFSPKVVGNITKGLTTPEDTIAIAKKIKEIGVDILLFAGGDGTARNIFDAIHTQIQVLGIPAGVKIHSAVYAVNPRSAGKAVQSFLGTRPLKTREAEVMDLDEESYRAGKVNTRLYGYLRVPEFKAYMQNVKSGGYSEKEAVAGMVAEVTETMRDDNLYIVGPGTTTRSIMERLGLTNTLIGIDVVRNRQVVANDVNEKQLFALLDKNPAKIILTVIGGQGHIFGRGNQQLSPRIIKKVGIENIIVVATKEKLISLRQAPLLVDTGDVDLDIKLCGYTRVITGFEDYVPCKIST
jgi:predicted polyphosphate/ATP-dependent NAD kinase